MFFAYIFNQHKYGEDISNTENRTYIVFFRIGGENNGEQVMKSLIQVIAQALVDYPDQVDVKETSTQQTTILELTVAKTDLGKVIGKKGKTANAMRIILSCAAAKKKKSVILEVVG